MESLCYTPMVECEKTSVCHVEHVDTADYAGPFSVSYEDAIPKDFTPYYEPAHFQKGAYLTDRGRPEFTDRSLVDWELQDTRSLLFMPNLRPEWPSVPAVREKEYQIYVLPLTATKDKAVNTLTDSNLYKESNVDRNVRLQIAKSSVDAVYADAHGQPLTLPQWRHMIENYLLNLGCEVQVRLDYKRALRQLKRNKLLSSPGKSIRISQEERAEVFQKVQANLYRRLRLDWDVDPID